MVYHTRHLNYRDLLLAPAGPPRSVHTDNMIFVRRRLQLVVRCLLSMKSSEVQVRSHPPCTDNVRKSRQLIRHSSVCSSLLSCILQWRKRRILETQVILIFHWMATLVKIKGFFICNCLSRSSNLVICDDKSLSFYRKLLKEKPQNPYQLR